MHDHDTNFTKEVIAKFKQHCVKYNLLPKAAPNLNGRVETVVQTFRSECLLKFIIFGK